MQPVFCQLRHTPLSGLSVVIDGRIFTRHMDVFFLFTENEHVKRLDFLTMQKIQLILIYLSNFCYDRQISSVSVFTVVAS